MGENGYNHNGGNGNGDRPRLTGLQRAFVDHWFDTRFNATEAAARAGYQGNRDTLAHMGAENLRKPHILAEIERRWSAHGVTGEEVIARYAAWMRFDPSVLFDDYGRIRWEKVREHGEFIKKIEYEAGKGFKVEVHDPLRAAEAIAKILLLRKQEGTGGLTIIVDI